MIKKVEGDLLSFKNWCAIVHCCNLYHNFGAGLAKTIAQKFPEALEADKKTVKGSFNKLGSYSRTNGDKIIYNLYAQVGIGNNGDPLKRNVRYDSLHDGLYKIFQEVQRNGRTLAIPKYMGCDRAGGDWIIAEKIIESVWNRFPIGLYIVGLPDYGKRQIQTM